MDWDSENTYFFADAGSNLNKLQYLLEMGLRGNHVLFEADDIRRAFGRNVSDLVDIDPNTVREVNQAIQKIFEIQNLEDQKDYIRDLSPNLQDILIHLYFQMIDRTIIQSSSAHH